MENLDATIDNMENSRFAARYSSLIKEMAASSGMTLTEVTCLLLVYYKFVKVNGPTAKKMNQKQFYQLFLVLFNVADVQVIERTLLAITKDVHHVGPKAWVRLFHLYTTGDIHVRMRFAFAVYDTKGTGVIDREQVGRACESFFVGQDEEELNELKADMTEFLMKKFDVDKDGVISYEDYSTVVTQQPILVEFLGWLFPSSQDRDVLAHCINLDSMLKSVDPN